MAGSAVLAVFICFCILTMPAAVAPSWGSPSGSGGDLEDGSNDGGSSSGFDNFAEFGKDLQETTDMVKGVIQDFSEIADSVSDVLQQNTENDSGVGKVAGQMDQMSERMNKTGKMVDRMGNMTNKSTRELERAAKQVRNGTYNESDSYDPSTNPIYDPGQEKRKPSDKQSKDAKKDDGELTPFEKAKQQEKQDSSPSSEEPSQPSDNKNQKKPSSSSQDGSGMMGTMKKAAEALGEIL